jgi:transposase
VFSERTSVGLDVHARSTAAAAIDTVTGEVSRARLSSRPQEVLGWVRSLPGPVAVAYEAGPTGFGLARECSGAGLRCVVAAPSKISRPSGDRVKTDERDAMLLARLLRNDDLVEVEVPTPAREALRDLYRGYDDARCDLMRARNRLSKLLLRHGYVYDEGRAWTAAHQRWLRSIRFELAGTGTVYDSAFEHLVHATVRRDQLAAEVEMTAVACEFTPVIRRLGCLRGIALLTGFGLAVEIGDWDRLTGSSIAAFVGLVPSESSSGTSRSLGGITKAGNSHVRRMLVEASWHHFKPYRPSTVLRTRWAAAPRDARIRGDAGNRRLHQRAVAFNLRHKKPVVANTAIARELAGWCWSLAVLPDHDTLQEPR